MILTLFVIWVSIGGTVALELKRNGTFDLINSLKDSHPDAQELSDYWGENFPKVFEFCFFIVVVFTFPTWFMRI
jgi:hypothetical protein